MAEPSLKDLIDWAKHVDQGMIQLEYLLERYGMLGGELDPNEVSQKLENIIVNAKIMKADLVQTDLDRLKKMSTESKAAIAMTETEEFRSIEGELSAMMNSLFPEEAAVSVEQQSVPSIDIQSQERILEEEESVTVEQQPEPLVNTESSPRIHEEGDMHVPLDNGANLSPSPCNLVEESFTEVEITPGLISKIPKSRLGAENDVEDLTTTSSRHALSSFHPIRKKTLIFSPNDTNATSHSFNSGSLTPQMVLQDRSNCTRRRVIANSKILIESNAEESTLSPEILERPTKPVLLSMQY